MHMIHRGKRIHRCSFRTPFEAFEGFLTFGSPADLGLRGKRPLVPLVLRLRCFHRVAFFKGGWDFPPLHGPPSLGTLNLLKCSVLFTLR